MVPRLLVRLLLLLIKPDRRVGGSCVFFGGFDIMTRVAVMFTVANQI
jgi:hypothetical protein